MRKQRNEMMVGLFVIVGFVMLSMVVFFVSGVYLFRKGYTVNVVYNYVSIIDKGAPVRMAGVRIGEVSRVELLHNDETGFTDVRVKVFIDETIKIRENYKFEIRGTHILSEPHIEITPMPGGAPMVTDGMELRGEKLESMESLIKNAQNISKGVNEIVNGKIEEADGDLKQAILSLKKSTDQLNEMTRKMTEGDGTVGKLVSSDELYQDVRGLVAEIKARPWRLLKKDKGADEKDKKFLWIF